MQQPQQSNAPVAPARTEILWDTFRVPHIYWRTTAEMRAVWPTRAEIEAHVEQRESF